MNHSLLGRFRAFNAYQILETAASVKFSKTSTVNSCRTWTRDMLEAMVVVALISTVFLKSELR
jgi:hypothetical protein